MFGVTTRVKKMLFLTFLAVMFILMQYEATSALTTVAAKSIDTFVLTTAILL